MKISMISEHASPLAALGGVDAGGQNVHVAALSTGLAKRGHQVSVYTRRDDPDLEPRVPIMPGLEVINVDAGPATAVPKDELLPYMDALAEGIAADWTHGPTGPPDVVHGHFWMSGLAALDAAGRMTVPGLRIPVVQTFHALGTVKRRHQGNADTSPAERAWLEPSVGRSVDRILATCSDEVFELKAMGVDSGKVSIAPCGVDLALFGRKGEVEPRRRRHRLVSVGRLVPRKGVDLVIRSLAELKRNGHDDVELVIVGGGGDSSALASDPEAQRLLALAGELGVQEQVDMRGQVPREDIPALLRSADAVVCTPWYEPFGIVPLEAMACGAPVVAASVGGLIDTVQDRTTGLQVRPKDSQALTAALNELLQNPEMGRTMGRNGQRRVHSRYSWSRVAADTEKAYQAALSPQVSEPSNRRHRRLQSTGGSVL